MPGFVAFRRRWAVGTDDLVLPAVFLLVEHLIWLVVMGVVLTYGEFDLTVPFVMLLWQYCLGYLVVLVGSVIMDIVISCLAMRGGILDLSKRSSMKNVVYGRTALLLVEVIWLAFATGWLMEYYDSSPVQLYTNTISALVICNALTVMTLMLTVWCAYDSAGRVWVEMKKSQRSMTLIESRCQRRRSTNYSRNWRQRKVLRAYQESWNQRCHLMFCCMRKSEKAQDSFADIARILSEFFRDLDVVPTDVVAGLVLLRKFQKIEQKAILKQSTNDVCQYLSGVPVTPATEFMPLGEPMYYEYFHSVIYFMHFALAAYSWPMYVMTNSLNNVCTLCSKTRCKCFPSCCRSAESNTDPDAIVIEDNCCGCNYAALQQMLETENTDIFYATFHVDINETPFFVAIDFTYRKIVVSIRGTLSMKDIMTDLNAESEPLPLDPPRPDWLGHKGMVNTAIYIKEILEKERIIELAMEAGMEKRSGDPFGLVLVGHSLGGGTAAILAILLREEYPDLFCYSYSPPGGLLSLPAVEYTRPFTTSVILGKDIVPRLGLHQMEFLRSDLMNAVGRSKDSKWKTITCSICCRTSRLPTSAAELQASDKEMSAYRAEKESARTSAVPPDYPPLYPPGTIIHIVRCHPPPPEETAKNKKPPEPQYQALRAANTDFDEVLISPVMIQDHMPENVLKALYKVVENFQKNDYKASQVEVPSVNPVSYINLSTLDMEDTRYAGDMD